MPPPRHVLITGGSRGIGLSIAQLFASKNYRCTLLSRSEDALKTAVATLHPLAHSSSDTIPTSTSSSPSQPAYYTHAYIPLSLTSPGLFSTSSPEALTTYLPLPRLAKENDTSRIDILINCAGITQATLFASLPTERLSQIIDTNLTSLMVLTKYLLRQGYFRSSKAKRRQTMEQEAAVGSPTIINVASLLGVQGGYGAVAYAASKAGVLGFTRALATEYAGHGVRVNALVPGYVETDMTKDLDPTTLSQRIPLGRLGRPDEIAHAALFLAENEYAHNCVVNLDGGLSAV